MDQPRAATGEGSGYSKLLGTLEQLLAIEATELTMALDEASEQLSAALGADKIDVFLYDPATTTLVAQGTSATPMGRRQHVLGLDRVPLANGGRTVEVFQTGKPYWNGQADEDTGVIVG